MKTVRIKSTKYSKTAIQFGSFVMRFNANGIAEIDLRDDNEELQLGDVVKTYSNVLCYLDEVADRELEAKRQGDVQYLNKVIESLREEVKTLKAVNETLATENTQLKIENKVYREQALGKSKNIKETTVNKGEDKKNDEGVVSENKVSDALNKKTVAELKEILNDTFADFKSEWKDLKVKEEIVNYILSKY